MGQAIPDRGELVAVRATVDESMSLEAAKRVRQDPRRERARMRRPADVLLDEVDVGEQVVELTLAQGKAGEDGHGPLPLQELQHLVHALPVRHLMDIHSQ